MRLLLDHGIPRSAAATLRNAGFDVLHTADIDLASVPDAEILRIATAHTRTIVTLDTDFHPLLALSGARQPSIIRIRTEAPASDLCQLLQHVISQCKADLHSGAIVSVHEDRLRIRNLPLG